MSFLKRIRETLETLRAYAANEEPRAHLFGCPHVIARAGTELLSVMYKVSSTTGNTIADIQTNGRYVASNYPAPSTAAIGINDPEHFTPLPLVKGNRKERRKQLAMLRRKKRRAGQ